MAELYQATPHDELDITLKLQHRWENTFEWVFQLVTQYLDRDNNSSDIVNSITDWLCKLNGIERQLLHRMGISFFRPILSFISFIWFRFVNESE